MTRVHFQFCKLYVLDVGAACTSCIIIRIYLTLFSSWICYNGSTPPPVQRAREPPSHAVSSSASFTNGCLGVLYSLYVRSVVFLEPYQCFLLAYSVRHIR